MDAVDLPISLQAAITRGYEDIPYFAETLLGLKLHDGQIKYLQNAKSKVNNLVSANRWGKTVIDAVLHLHACFYKVGIGRGNAKAWERAEYSTANLAPHSEATQPVFKVMLAILTSSFPINQEDGSVKNNECMIGWMLDPPRTRNSVPYYIGFTNKSETLFRSLGEDKGTSIQGKKFGIVTYDEGGRSNHLKVEIDANIIPRLADLNGRLHITSTPDMESQSILHHYKIFQKGLRGEEGYYSQEGSIRENYFLLRNNPTYIEDEEKRLKNDPIKDQTLYGKFVFAGGRLFPANEIVEATDNNLTPGIGYESNHKYVIGIDTAIGEDEMVYTVMDVTTKPHRVVRVVAAKGSSKSPQIHMDDLVSLVTTYNLTNTVKVILETYNGESARFYMDMPYWLQRITRCFGGWQPPGFKDLNRGGKMVKKAEVLQALRKLLAAHELKIPDEQTLQDQLSIYREDDTKLKTDRVMSLALTAWLATDGQPKHPELILQTTNW
jgi:hypothetical protein